MTPLVSQDKSSKRLSEVSLIGVGLTLAVVLAVWIGTVAASISPFREQLNSSIVLLVTLNEFEASIEKLDSAIGLRDNGALSSDEVDATITSCIKELTAIHVDVRLAGRNHVNDEVGQRLEQLSTGFVNLIEAARGVAAITAEPSDASDNTRVTLAKGTIEHHLREMTTAIRRDNGELSAALMKKWEELVRLGLMAVLLAVCLAVAMLLRMRYSSRRHAQDMKELHESRERFRLLAENVPGIIYLCLNDNRYTMTFISDSVQRVTGYSREEFLSNKISFVEIFHPDDAPFIAPAVNAAVEQGKPFELQYRIRHRDGSVRWIEEVGVGIYRDGKLECLEGFITDVTNRHVAEREVESQRSFLRQVIDLNPNLIFAKDRQGKFTLVNKSLADVYGTTVECLLGKTDADFNSNAEEVENFRRDDLEVMDRGEKFIPEEMVTDADGRVHWVQTHKRPIVNEHGTVDQVLGVATDITRLKRAELIRTGRNRVLERMARGAPLEEVLETLVSAFQDVLPTHSGAVLLFGNSNDSQSIRLAAAPNLNADVRQHLATCNPEKVLACGKASADGHRAVVHDLQAVDDTNEVKPHLLQAGFRSCWSQLIRSESESVLGAFMFFGTATGEPLQPDIEIMESAAKIAAISIQRNRAEMELRQSQSRLRASDRLASIGTLTAGLGHDMNNVLFPLQCRLDSVDWQLIPPDLVDVLRSTRETVSYLYQLSDGLRLLAADPDRADASAPVTNIDEWWNQVASLIQDALPRNIKLTQHLEANLPAVAVAPHRLTQAILNLAVNAAEATEDESPVDVWARRAADGKYVEFGVTDFGCGMTPDVKAHALDPFFTTKTRALSTGLGLSLVHGVAKTSGGTVEIDSTPGRGTTVTLRIPIAPPAPLAKVKIRSAVMTLGDPRTAGWVSSILSFEGYNVLRASDGEIPESDVWITDPTDRNLETARVYLSRSARPQVIVLGDASASWTELGVTIVRSTEELSSIKAAVRETLHRADATHHAK